MVGNDAVNKVDYLGLDALDDLKQYVSDVARAAEQYASDLRMNTQFASDWFFNEGSDDRTYGQSERLTQLVMSSNGMKEVMRKICANGQKSDSYHYDTLQGYYEGVVQGGYVSNASEWQVGGFIVKATNTGNKNSAGATIFDFEMTNKATWRSLLGLGVMRNQLNKLPFVDIPPIPDLDRTKTPLGGSITQYFKWSQPVCCK